MRSLSWTPRARSDLTAIRAFIEQDSAHFAAVVVERIISAAERIVEFPESGRQVPELPGSGLREIIHRPYRIVYRIVGESEIHILTIHHSARQFPAVL